MLRAARNLAVDMFAMSHAQITHSGITRRGPLLRFWRHHRTQAFAMQQACHRRTGL